MAAQEMVEHLRSDAEEAEDADGLSEGVNLAVQFARIMALFAKGKNIHPQSLCQWGLICGSWLVAIPRLALRKSPSQTLAFLAELEQLVSPAAIAGTVAESRSLVRGASLLVQELGVWAQGRAENDPAELTVSYVSKPTYMASQRLVKLGYGRPF